MSSNLLRYLDSLAEQEQSLPSSPGKSSTVSTRVGQTYYKAHSSNQLSRRTSISESSASSSGSTTRNDDDTRRRINQEYIPKDNYDDQGLTPLMITCRKDRVDEVKKILNTGVPIDDIDADGRTALFHAITYSSADVINLLLQSGADPYIVAGDYERHCLHQACLRKKNPLEILRLLIQTMGKEAKLEQDKAGLIPIHLAITVGQRNIVTDLLDSHIDEQLKAVTKDYRDSALHLACRRKDPDMVKLLTDYDAQINLVNLEGQTPLHIAATESDIESMRILHSCEASGNLKDRRNRSPLHLATETGNMEVIETLLDDFNADVKQRSKDGSTLVHLAAKSGQGEVATIFVEKGVPIQMPNKEGITALHEASKQGHIKVVRALLEKGADFNIKTKEGYTPLHTAVRFGKYKVVEVLAGVGASVCEGGGPNNDTSLHLAAKLQRYSEQVTAMLLNCGAKVNNKNDLGETPIHVAIKHRNYPVVKLLINNKAKVFTVTEDGETTLHLTVRYLTVAIALEIIDEMKRVMDQEEFVKAINTRNRTGETALHYCANIQPKIENRRTYMDLAKLLIDNKSELMPVEEKLNETPLHYCAKIGNVDVLRMILTAMTPRELVRAINMQNKKGHTPLIKACIVGDAGMVRTLVEHEARLDLFDEDGKAPLHVASQYGHLECVEHLLSHRAYINAKTKIGLTSVMLATANGHDMIVDLFTNKYEADIDIKSFSRSNALHYGAANGHLHPCKTLIDAGIDPNVKDMNDQTPIHLATKNDHYEVVKLFLDRFPYLGSEPNKDGNTCAHIAACNGSIEVMKLLVKANPSVASATNKITGQSPLHFAAKEGHTEMLQLLLNQGVPTLEEDNAGMTALHLASKHGQLDSIGVLKGNIPYGVISNKTGFNPLHVAAEFDQTDCINEFLTRVSPTVKSKCPVGMAPEETEYAYSCLHLAAKSGNVETTVYLLNCEGLEVDATTTKKGLIPLHMAVMEGHLEVASLLLSRCAKHISFKCAVGRTSLHFAAANGHLDLVQLLLTQGSDINDQDSCGWTALHYAAEGGYLEVVEFLIQFGAISSIEDNDGKIPMTFAAKNHHLDVLKFLMKQECDTDELIKDRKFLAHLMICCKLDDNQSVRDFILQSQAPMYTAIKLTLMFREESERVQDKSEDYNEIAAYCEELAHNILHIATTFGSEAFLNAIDDEKQALLDILIDNEFKDCVSHSNVQSYLSDLWNGDSYKVSSEMGMVIMTLCFIFPPLWFVLSLPFHRFSKIPTLKFICHCISHLYFIIVLSLVIVVPWDRSYLEIYPTPWECALLIWLCALFLSQLADNEFQILRLCICLLASIALGLNLAAVFVEGRAREDLMYARDNVLAYCLLILVVQIFDFLSMHILFGPWAVIIKNLMYDVVKFLFVLFLFIMAFALHMCVVYKPAYNKARVDFPTQLTGFNIKDDFETIIGELFWGVLGMGTQPTRLTAVQRNDSPAETYYVASIVFALYQIVTVVVLMNLLIAMMGNTYAIIDERSHTEWRFGRARLIWYMTKSTSVPMPLNMITTFLRILKIVYKANCCCCVANINKMYQEMALHSNAVADMGLDPEKRKEPSHIKNVVPWREVVTQYYMFFLHEEEEKEEESKESDKPKEDKCS